ncbi:MAG: POTRA domain-containing protein, partial [bacterium]
MRNLFLKNVLVLIITVITFGNIFSQPEGPTTYRIASIGTKGNKNYQTGTILSYSGLAVGQEISIPSDDLREALNRLWNVGIFSDVQIYVDKKFGNEAYLTIQVEELPRVQSVEISGNDEYSKEDIREKINLVPGEVVSEQKLKDIQYNLEKFYAEEGYSLAKVKVDQLLSGNEALVRVKIVEGKELTVRHISFEGNKKISSGDLKGAMDETTEKVWWKIWDGASFDKKKFEEDLKLIENYYKEKGYKDAIVVSNDLKILSSKEDVDIKIKVDEGKKYYVNEVKIEGDKIYDEDIFRARLGMQKGDVYNIKKLQENLYGNESESDINSVYLDSGYLSV